MITREDFIKEKLIFNGGLRIPEYQSELVVNGDFHISFTKPMPNAWHRFWMRFLLGWEWRKLKIG